MSLDGHHDEWVDPGKPSGSLGHDGSINIIRINAVTVPEESNEELARRFSERVGAVDNAEGFEGFELLRDGARLPGDVRSHYRWPSSSVGIRLRISGRDAGLPSGRRRVR